MPPTPSDLPFTFDALRGAYAAGLSAEAVVDEVFARLDAIDDPAILDEIKSALVPMGYAQG